MDQAVPPITVHAAVSVTRSSRCFCARQVEKDERSETEPDSDSEAEQDILHGDNGSVPAVNGQAAGQYHSCVVLRGCVCVVSLLVLSLRGRDSLHRSHSGILRDI